MKRLLGITGFILIACVCVSSVFAQPVSADIQQTAATQSVSRLEEGFVIMAEDNRIVAYKKGESRPYIKTDTQVSVLPKADILSLKNGIEVKTERELREVLEDYCS